MTFLRQPALQGRIASTVDHRDFAAPCGVGHGQRSLLYSALATALALAAAPAFAQDTSESATDNALETISVVGTRTERTLGEVEATISVYDKKEIDRRLFRDIKDLVRYEPGVSVGGTGSRFGLEGFTIRGVGGNRVLTLVDGIRMPEEFSFGPFLSSRRDFVDIDQVERIEIARGPVSTLYGSDALGGVVAITTRAPNDYVGADNPTHLDLKTGYSSADDSVIGSLNGAYGNDRLAGLVTVTQRSGQETETAGAVGGTGPGRTEADPQDIDTQTLGFKLAWSPLENHNLIAAYETFDSNVDTELLSDAGTVSRGTLVNSRVAEDERERERYSLNYRYAGAGLIDNVVATLYRQQSETTQMTFEERTPPSGLAQTRVRDSRFEQEISGAFAQATSLFELAGMEHALTYGFDLYRTENANRRDGGTTDVTTGQPVAEFTPLPTRDFPLTEVENRAVFLQDEIVMLDGRLRVTPGLRYDDYEATTSPDELYFEGNPGVAPPADFADDELTLKLGALYRFSDGVAAWVRYSEGFRAPPYDDVNVGFSNFIGGYKTIAAPDLAAETSEGQEVGLRLTGEAGQLQLALFRTRYENFIESLVPAPQFAATRGIDPSDGLLTFQSVNRDEVEIEGVELRGSYALGALGEPLRDFAIEGALAYADGEDSSGAPVDTVDPLNFVLGLRWAPATLPVDGELIWTWSDGKDASDISGNRIATQSYHLLDLLVHWDISDRFTLDAGVFNLADETYLRWADTAGIGADTPQRFTPPGRNVSITLRAEL